MIDATDIKAHPTASSLNKGGCPPPDWWHQGGMISKLHVVCDSKGDLLRLHLREGPSPVPMWCSKACRLRQR